METFAQRIQELGREARACVGKDDLVFMKRLKFSTQCAELIGRLLLNFAVEAQINHSVMHGAYAGILGAGRFTPAAPTRLRSRSGTASRSRRAGTSDCMGSGASFAAGSTGTSSIIFIPTSPPNRLHALSMPG